jgi:hypothetical protein
MSDDLQPKKTEEKTPTQQFVDKVLPTGKITDITTVLGDTVVDPTLDTMPSQGPSVVSAPTPSAIPQRPENQKSRQPAKGLPTQHATAGSVTGYTMENEQAANRFSAESPNSKPPIFATRIGRFLSMIIGLVLFVGMVGAIVYFLTSGRVFIFPSLFEDQNTGDAVVNTIDTGNTQPDSAVVNVNAGPVDSDGDGLLDDQELQLKTDVKKIDTDGDGLTDRQEVEIYKTAPLQKDTDRDGFSDGAEVRNFYNPNGDGELLNISEAIDSASEPTSNMINQ